MAQIIALQRGSVSIAHNSTTLLFTGPSTGSSTRLIVGYLGYICDFTFVNGYCTFSVLRSGAASPNYTMFAATYPAVPAKLVSFTPHNTRTGWHGNTNTTTENSPVLFAPNVAGINQAQCHSESANGPMRAFYNSDIMIGPSDAIYVSWFDNGGSARTANVQYCFLTVNE